MDLVSDGDHDVSNGSSHADVATNSAHVALVAGNPHAVTPAEAAYTPGNSADWAGDPADLQAAVDRLAAHIAAGGGARTAIGIDASHRDSAVIGSNGYVTTGTTGTCSVV